MKKLKHEAELFKAALAAGARAASASTADAPANAERAVAPMRAVRIVMPSILAFPSMFIE